MKKETDFENPFFFDPFAIIYKAFRNIYPDARVDYIQWVEEVEEDCCGWTDFNDDGTVLVYVLATQNIIQAVDVLAHELAHVAVGAGFGHNKEWQSAFSAIYDEYNRIMIACENMESGDA